MKNMILLAWTVGAVLILSAFNMPAHAAVTEAWVHRYRNTPDDSDSGPFKAVFDSAGNVIVIGGVYVYPDTRSIAVVKYSGSRGSIVWQQRYRSAGSSTSDDVAAVGVDGSNNIIVIGSSNPDGAGPVDYFTLKFAATDGALLWEKHHNSPAVGLGSHEMAMDDEGNVIVTVPSPVHEEWNEESIAFCTLKYAAADGALLWEKCYTGPRGRPYYLQAIAVDASGNVVMTGSSDGDAPIYRSDIYTAKYSGADGSLLWENRYNGPANRNDFPNAIIVDASGNVVVTGYSDNGISNYDSDIYTAKYAATDGTLLWERRYNGPANRGDQGTALAVDPGGNVIVMGASDNDGPRYDSDIYIAKYAAADGSLLWEQRYDGPANSFDDPVAIAVEASGDVIMTASSETNAPQRNSDFFTAKYAGADGALLWEQRYDGPVGGNDYPASVAVDASGNAVVTGSADTTDLNVDSEIYTAKYAAADGALLWDEYYDGAPSYTTFAKGVAADASGNVIVTGSAYNPLSEDLEYYTAKYAAADGALLWEQRYNDSADDEATAVAVDSSGDVVVTGCTAVSGGHDFYTAKYAAADGALLWEKRYNGPGNSFDFARALTVDAGGNVIVIGDSSNGTNGDILVIKYAADDGSVLWERRYSGPATDREHDDWAIALALDSQGDVVIAGYSETAAGEEYYTAKHAGADGALLWERRHNNPDAYDEVESLAVDVSGNVVVTGTSGTIKYLADGSGGWTNTSISGKSLSVDANGNVVVAKSSYNTNGNFDLYTAKYAAANGAMLWERRYNGPADGDDGASTVAVDASGNVVVTGGSSNGTNTDYFTAKYAATDGALLWEKRYNGPADGEDFMVFSHSLALGPNGMVAITGRSANLDGNFDIATVVYRENLPAVSIALVPTGVRLRFVGTPSQSYQIQRASTVTGPWTTIATLTAPADGLVESIDITPLGGSAFYRTGTP